MKRKGRSIAQGAGLIVRVLSDGLEHVQELRGP